MKKLSLALGITIVGLLLASCTSGDDTADTSAEERDNRSEENNENRTDNQTEDGNASAEEKSEQPSTSNQADDEEYYKELAVLGEYDDDLYPDVLENLELPGIHENTLIYNGTINPDHSIRFEFPHNGETIDPEVSEEGHFAISFSDKEIRENDDIRVHIFGDGLPHEQTFELPVHPSEDGMEVIQSDADTSAQEEALLEEVSLPDIQTGTKTYEAETGDMVKNVHYSIDGEMVRQDLLVKSADHDNPEGEIVVEFDESPAAGQTFEFYILANGVTAKIEKQVKKPSEDERQSADRIREETELPEITLDTTNYEGKTDPNAEVKVTDPELPNWIVTLDLDEDGNFTLPLEDRIEEPGQIIQFTITDEDGNSTTIEKEVQ
ncbi:hypothetical protein QU593_19590 [Rossellomorea marisflavi]|uniref:hypothetical protein n=1 Tax=Rossellomorea marisflavi TaxID=189381 RepID=UPI0025AF6D76|nr:hypothetical protein [Rossellomorea marisflavi]WJV18308.1 hypothetical protein QU593_19590 [Rossellomorea marisflavi]